MKTIAATFALLTAGLLASSDAVAADPHIDEVAYSLQQQTAAACREAYYHFRRYPEFEHLYSDLYEMHQRAVSIHDQAHFADCPTRIRGDVDRIDELFHHTEEVLAGMAPYRRAYGCDYHYRRLAGYMAGIEDTIHHLQEDLNPVGVPVPGGVTVPAPPVPAGPAIPSGPVFNGPTYQTPTYPTPVYPGSVGSRPHYRFGKRGLSVSVSLGR